VNEVKLQRLTAGRLHSKKR